MTNVPRAVSLLLVALCACGCRSTQGVRTRIGVTSSPSGSVYLDGQDTGHTTPATLQLRADGKLHRVTVKSPRHSSEEALFYALPSKFQSSFHFELSPVGQGLTLLGVPHGANVSARRLSARASDQPIEVSRHDDAVWIASPPGELEVQVDASGYKSWRRSLTVADERWGEVRVELLVDGAGVRLFGPSALLVQVEGHGALKLRSGGTLLALEPGWQRLVVRADGYIPHAVEVEVRDGRHVDVQLRMVRLDDALRTLAAERVVPSSAQGVWGDLLRGGRGLEDALLEELRELARYSASFRWGSRSWHALRAFVEIAPDARGSDLRDALSAGRSAPNADAVSALRSFFDPIAIPTYEAAVLYGSAPLASSAAFSLGQLQAGEHALRRRLDDAYLDSAASHALWSALAETGDARARERVLERAEQGARLYRDDVSARNTWGIDALRAGKPALAVDIYESATLDFPDEHVFHYNLACAYALVGQRRRAVEALEKSVEARRGDWIYIERDPDLASLRDEPAFRELIDRLRREARP